MSQLNFISHEQISERLYIFTEGYSMVHRFTIGVIIGDEKVLVIDAGLGAADGLRETIESIVGTGKPLVCACTHCHPDHVGSAKLFDEAYCSHLDWPARADFALSTQQRLTDLKGFALNSPEVLEYCQEHIIENEDTIFEFTGNYPVEFPLLMDQSGNIIKQYPVVGLPTTYIINPQGVVTHRAVGSREWDNDQLLNLLRNLQQN